MLDDAVKEEVSASFCLGDIVGYGADPKMCLVGMRNICGDENIIRGNHEEAVCDLNMARREFNENAFFAAQYSRVQLSDEDMNFLSELPSIKVLSDQSVTLIHGSFTPPQTMKYVRGMYEFENELCNLPTHICIGGHTHFPSIYRQGSDCFESITEGAVELDSQSKYFINTGSVGQPRDGDVRASYAILEFVDGKVTATIRRVFYDIQKTADAIIAAELPRHLADRLFHGR